MHFWRVTKHLETCLIPFGLGTNGFDDITTGPNILLRKKLKLLKEAKLSNVTFDVATILRDGFPASLLRILRILMLTDIELYYYGQTDFKYVGVQHMSHDTELCSLVSFRNEQATLNAIFRLLAEMKALYTTGKYSVTGVTCVVLTAATPRTESESLQNTISLAISLQYFPSRDESDDRSTNHQGIFTFSKFPLIDLLYVTSYYQRHDASNGGALYSLSISFCL
jgi:hypothetical protein